MLSLETSPLLLALSRENSADNKARFSRLFRYLHRSHMTQLNRAKIPLVATLIARGWQDHLTRALELGADLTLKGAQGDSPLVMAIQRGDIKLLSQLLAHGTDVNAPITQTATPLILAASKGDSAMVKFLLDHGASVDHRSPQGKTAFFAAILNQHYDLALTLRQRGADPMTTDNHGLTVFEQTIGSKHYHNTILHIATNRYDLHGVETLLKLGANPSVRNREGQVPHQMVSSSRPDGEKIVRLLIKYGADIDARKGNDSTALMWAAGKGDLQLMKFYLSLGANINACSFYSSVLSKSVTAGDLELVRWVLDQGGRTDQPELLGTLFPLAEAAKQNRIDIARLLLEHGADPNMQDADRWSAEAALHHAVTRNHGEMVRLLIANGANPILQSKLSNCTAMHLAVDRKHHDLAMYLARFADHTEVTCTPQGVTPLMIAVKSREPDLPLIREMIIHGAKIAASPSWGDAISHSTADTIMTIVDACQAASASCDLNFVHARLLYENNTKLANEVKRYVKKVPPMPATHQAEPVKSVPLFTACMVDENKAVSEPLEKALFHGEVTHVQSLLPRVVDQSRPTDGNRFFRIIVKAAERITRKDDDPAVRKRLAATADLLLQHGWEISAEVRHIIQPTIVDLLLANGYGDTVHLMTGRRIAKPVITAAKEEQQPFSLTPSRLITFPPLMNAPLPFALARAKSKRPDDQAVIQALISGNREVVAKWVRLGGDINLLKVEGEPVLASLLVRRTLPAINTFRFLLMIGADPEASDQGENSAYMLAIKHGHKDLAQLLLQYGAQERGQNDCSTGEGFGCGKVAR